MSVPAPAADVAGRRRAAAFRLKHDLGKYARLTAPKEREPDFEAMRERLARDLGETRASRSGTWNAAEVFDAWQRDEAGLFPEDDPDLSTVSRAVAVVRELLPALSALPVDGLIRLDEASRAIAEAAARLHRRQAAERSAS